MPGGLIRGVTRCIAVLVAHSVRRPIAVFAVHLHLGAWHAIALCDLAGDASAGARSVHSARWNCWDHKHVPSRSVMTRRSFARRQGHSNRGIRRGWWGEVPASASEKTPQEREEEGCSGLEGGRSGERRRGGRGRLGRSAPLLSPLPSLHSSLLLNPCTPPQDFFRGTRPSAIAAWYAYAAMTTAFFIRSLGLIVSRKSRFVCPALPGRRSWRNWKPGRPASSNGT